MVSIPITHPRVSHFSPMHYHALPMLAFCRLTYVPLVLVGGVVCCHGPGEPRCEHSDAALHNAERARPLGYP